MTVEKHYDLWAETYDKGCNRTKDLEEIVAKETLSKIKFKTVIEIGCGTGKNTRWLNLKADKIYALDNSQEMMNIAKKKVNSKNVEYIKTDLTDKWQVEDEVGDLVICSLVLEHIENIDFIFYEANRVLKSGGYFYISELHPFKQQSGKQANFNLGDENVKIKSYIHNISDFWKVSQYHGFHIEDIIESFDQKGQKRNPRLLTILFKKN